MKKLYILLLFSIVTTCICKAQEEYQPGIVTLKDGTKLSGLIKLNDDEPWYNQRYIRVKDSASVAKNPSVKSKKYKVDEMQSYQVGPRIFDKVHYVDMENLQLKSLGTNDHMMERLAAGRINAHRFYAYPEDFAVYSGTDDEIAQKEQRTKNDLINGYKILMQKDKETKLKNAFDVDLLKYFEDTPEVQAKFQSGGYGNQPVVAKKGLAARMISMAKKTTFKEEEANGIIAAFNDYNEKNAGKQN